MAKQTVKPKQTVASLAKTNNILEDDFYLANPGVKTLRPGQVVKIPKITTFQFGQAGTGGTNTTGNSFYNSPSNSNGATFSYAPAGNNSYASLNTPVVQPPSQANFQTPTTNGFTAPAGYTNLTPSQSQNIPPSAGNVNLTPSQSQNIPTAQTSVSSVPAKPAGVYTGDPNDPNTAAWKAYWNYSAQNPSTVQTQGDAPRVMSRSEIWNMKANSRRKKMAKSAGDDQSFSGSNAPTPVTPVAQPTLVKSIVWGI